MSTNTQASPTVSMRIRSLQAFVAVAELSSYRAAGERLALDGSTVSRLVTRLETSLGVELFKRDTRNVQLTKAGQAALPSARRALEAVQDLADQASRRR
jgi:DNA-binding transcriptional LysR family regulator